MRRWFLIALVCAAWPAQRAAACGEGECTGVTPPHSEARGTCPTPPCGDATDPPTGPSQLARKAAMASGPLTLRGDGGEVPISCFAVQRKMQNFYFLLNSEPLPNGDAGFHRYAARTGLNDWIDLGFVTGIDENAFPWMNGFRCPDPHFQSSTSPKMTMFYTGLNGGGAGAPPPGGVVMRATSGDDGASWTVDPSPVLVGDGTHWPYMPAYIEFLNRHFLAVAWICNGSGDLRLSEIRVYESLNGIDNWVHIATPVETGDCTMEDWDSGSVNRPRFIVDPTGTELILFYGGYPWDGTLAMGNGAVSRRNASQGVAVSADGVNWAVADEPIIVPVDTPYWDNWSVVKATMVYSDDAQTTLRLYYEGRGATASGFAVADALFSSLVLPAAPAPAPPQQLAERVLGSPSVAAGSSIITASPNPTTGTVTIGLDLSRIRAVGSTDVAIFDITGRAVRTLWEGASPSSPATLQWDGRESSGQRVSAGNYLVRVRVAGEIVGTHLITQVR